VARIAGSEYVEHLTDLICRRSTIALLGNARRDVLRELAGVTGSVLGWDEAYREAEVETALAEVRVPAPRA